MRPTTYYRLFELDWSSFELMGGIVVSEKLHVKQNLNIATTKQI